MPQRPRPDVAALVAVQVQIEPALGGEVEKLVEQRVDLRGDEGDGAQDPAGRGDPIGELTAFGGAEDLHRRE